MSGSFNPPTITGSIKRLTSNFSLAIPYFDAPGWGTAMERNLDTLDAVLYLVTGLTGITGPWTYSTAYVVGNRVVDVTDDTVYQCLVSHTSAASGTFADERAAHPTYWEIITSGVVVRGDWADATQYNTGEIILDSGRTGVANQSFVSSGSYDDDVAADNITTIVDVSAFTSVEVATHAAALKAAVANTDEFALVDTENGNVLKKVRWSDLKALLATINNAAYQPLDADLTTWAGVSSSANGRSLVSAASYAAMRTLLDLEAGTDFYSKTAADAAFQPKATNLTTWAGVTPSANGQTLVETTYAGMKSLLDLQVGIDFYSIASVNSLLSAKANLASPALTGNPTAPTQSDSNNSTRLATTEFVKNVAPDISPSEGALGTYVMATRISAVNMAYGDTTSGSNLRASNSDDVAAVGPSLSGTYRLMGEITGGDGDQNTSVWCRVA